jgi:hypothetical protein
MKILLNSVFSTLSIFALMGSANADFDNGYKVTLHVFNNSAYTLMRDDFAISGAEPLANPLPPAELAPYAHAQLTYFVRENANFEGLLNYFSQTGSKVSSCALNWKNPTPESSKAVLFTANKKEQFICDLISPSNWDSTSEKVVQLTIRTA